MSDRDENTSGAASDGATDSEGTQKVGGLGGEGTIPPSTEGLAAGIGEESSNFNPEEDPESDTTPDSGAETNPSPS